jgi:hypothetical protein
MYSLAGGGHLVYTPLRSFDTSSLCKRKLVAQVFENFNRGVDAVRGIFADPSSLSFNLPRFLF